MLGPVTGLGAHQSVVGERGVAGVADHHRHLAHAVHELHRGDDAVNRGAGVATRPHTCTEICHGNGKRHMTIAIASFTGMCVS